MYGARARMAMKPLRPLGLPGEPFPWQEVRVRGFRAGDVDVDADVVVLAAGAWTGEMLDDAGFPLPLRPLRRMAYSVSATSGALRELLDRDVPALVIPGGVFVRPDPGGAFHVEFGLRRPYGSEDPVPEAWELGALPILSSYLPAFEGVAPSESWVGRYDMNIVTGTPIVERLADGLVVAAGTSGSGVMKADAIGRVAAALALGNERAELYGGTSISAAALSAPSGEERLVI